MLQKVYRSICELSTSAYCTPLPPSFLQQNLLSQLSSAQLFSAIDEQKGEIIDTEGGKNRHMYRLMSVRKYHRPMMLLRCVCRSAASQQVHMGDQSIC